MGKGGAQGHHAAPAGGTRTPGSGSATVRMGCLVGTKLPALERPRWHLGSDLGWEWTQEPGKSLAARPNPTMHASSPGSCPEPGPASWAPLQLSQSECPGAPPGIPGSFASHSLGEQTQPKARGGAFLIDSRWPGFPHPGLSQETDPPSHGQPAPVPPGHAHQVFHRRLPHNTTGPAHVLHACCP